MADKPEITREQIIAQHEDFCRASPSEQKLRLAYGMLAGNLIDARARFTTARAQHEDDCA